MLKKAKVVNILFEDKLNITAKSNHSDFPDNSKAQQQQNLQAFIRSPESTTETYELLNILRSPAINLAEFREQRRDTYEEFMDFERHKNDRVREKERILPRATHSEGEKDDNIEINPDLPGSNSTQMDAPDGEINPKCKKNVRVMSGFYQYSEDGGEYQDVEEKSNEYAYVIPEKYANGLYLILMHFLSYKMTSGKDNVQKTLNLHKRPYTSINQTSDIRIKQTSREGKPFTPLCMNRKSPQQTPMHNISEDLTSHLEKLMQMEKDLDKKTKRVALLESQLSGCYQIISEKNNQIKELNQREGTMKKKLKYEVDKIVKCKVMEDINQIYVKNIQQQKASGKSIFEINGKRFVKSDIFQNFVQNTFLTSTKPNLREENKENVQKQPVHIETEENEMQSKNPMKNSKKPQVKGVNKKLELMKLTKQLDVLTKQIVKFEAERENLLDELAENSGKIEKSIQELQETILIKRLNVEKCTKELMKLKEGTVGA